jgi:hypothetical protein
MDQTPFSGPSPINYGESLYWEADSVHGSLLSIAVRPLAAGKDSLL